VLTLALEFRIAIVTGWLDDLDRHLARPRFAASPTTSGLRQQIREFRTPALPLQAAREARTSDWGQERRRRRTHQTQTPARTRARARARKIAVSYDWMAQ